MFPSKIYVTSLSKFKTVNFVKQFRLISSCNVFLKDEKDSKDGSSGNNQSKKDNLNKLLQDLVQRSGIKELPPEQKIELAEPRKKQRKKLKEETEQNLKDAQDEKKQPLETRLENAAKNVAKALGGDEVKTESELLNALLSFKKDKKPQNIQDIVKGMKTEMSEQAPKTRSQVVKESLIGKKLQMLEQAPKTRSQVVKESLIGKKLPSRFISKKAAPWIPDETLRLFGEQPLGIFPENYMDTVKKEPVTLTTWNQLAVRQIKFSVTHPPKNYFEEMIQWTEQGKLWHFPIDNEQGMDEEKKIHFSEHIMLYDLLDPWCPSRGPIRHFMELVCVGLSKNPWYTVQEKRDHIQFYQQYFREKNDLLRETGCGEIPDILPDSKLVKTKETKKTAES